MLGDMPLLIPNMNCNLKNGHVYIFHVTLGKDKLVFIFQIVCCRDKCMKVIIVIN